MGGRSMFRIQTRTLLFMSQLWMLIGQVSLQGMFGFGFTTSKRPPSIVGQEFDPPASVRAQMNFSVDPCHDFYEYACGGFEQRERIPKDMGGFARSWDGGSSKIYQEMRSVLDADTGKAGTWFRSCMMVDHINKLGAKPLQPYLEQIAAIETYRDLWVVLAQFQLWDVPAFFEWWVGADNLEPTLTNLYLGTGGLILPDQSYYTQDTAEMRSHRAAYRAYIVEQLVNAGLPPVEAQHDADACLAIETELAIYQRLEPYVPLRQSFAHLSQAELAALLPAIDFPLLFRRLNISDDGAAAAATAAPRRNIVLRAPQFFGRLSNFFAKRGPRSLIPYLRWHLVYNLSPLLSRPFLDATLRVDTNLLGISARPRRWHKCVAAARAALPSAVDRLYAARYFSPADRRTALGMLSRIRDAFRRDLAAAPWMSPAARAAALRKLDGIFFEVGRPARWEPCDVNVTADSYFENSLAACAARKRRQLARLRSPPDRRRWSMSVTSVNSYYDNAVNGLFITAGMLQPPFFAAGWDAARNYGGVGAIMGHELTHGFDDTGRQYDSDSRLRDWWDPETVAAFRARAGCIADLYSSFEVDGLHLAGNRTLGENIADAGGVKAAYGAWLAWRRGAGGPGEADDCGRVDSGAMPATHALCRRAAEAGPPAAERQLFWVSYGQNWCDKERRDALRLAVQTDEHSPDRFRVNGPLSQNPDFARDWSCPAGAPMNPSHKCSLW